MRIIDWNGRVSKTIGFAKIIWCVAIVSVLLVIQKGIQISSHCQILFLRHNNEKTQPVPLRNSKYGDQEKSLQEKDACQAFWENRKWHNELGVGIGMCEKLLKR